MTRPVLVDTSAWVDFLRPGDSPVDDLIPHLVRSGHARLCGPVLCELLQGVRSPRQATRLQDLLRALSYIEDDRSDWLAAGYTLQHLRRGGITVPLSDALIATLAIRRALDVLTLDQHFRHFELRLIPIDG